MSPWLLLPAAYLVALGFWPLRRAPNRARWAGTLLLVGILAGLPWLADRGSLPALALLVLLSAAALPAKLIDSARAPDLFDRLGFRDWVAYLLAPYVICLRGHLHDPEGDRAQDLRLALRGLLEMAAGTA